MLFRAVISHAHKLSSSSFLLWWVSLAKIVIQGLGSDSVQAPWQQASHTPPPRLGGWPGLLLWRQAHAEGRQRARWLQCFLRPHSRPGVCQAAGTTPRYIAESHSFLTVVLLPGKEGFSH